MYLGWLIAFNLRCLLLCLCVCVCHVLLFWISLCLYNINMRQKKQEIESRTTEAIRETEHYYFVLL